MIEIFLQMPKYDLTKRTEDFAVEIRKVLKKLNQINSSDCNQLLRASASIGANYIEANNSLGIKDFVFRLKIARKEAREAEYWLKIIKRTSDNKNNVDYLIVEAIELSKILSSMILNSKKE